MHVIILSIGKGFLYGLCIFIIMCSVYYWYGMKYKYDEERITNLIKTRYENLYPLAKDEYNEINITSIIKEVLGKNGEVLTTGSVSAIITKKKSKDAKFTETKNITFNLSDNCADPMCLTI